jgi:hypothetical protein
VSSSLRAEQSSCPVETRCLLYKAEEKRYSDQVIQASAPRDMALQASIFPGFVSDWSNVNVLHRNTLPPRAHFYNYGTPIAALSFDREQSLYQSLNGTWRFHYDQSPFEAPDWGSANTSAWDTIKVCRYEAIRTVFCLTCNDRCRGCGRLKAMVILITPILTFRFL